MLRTIYLRLHHDKKCSFVRTYLSINDFKFDKKKRLTKKLEGRVETLRDKIIYCDYIEKNTMKYGFQKNRRIANSMRTVEKRQDEENLMNSNPHSIVFRHLQNVKVNNNVNSTDELEETIEKKDKQYGPIYMPYKSTDSFENTKIKSKEDTFMTEKDLPILNKDYKELYELYLDSKNNPNIPKEQIAKLQSDIFNDQMSNLLPSHVPSDWMNDYEQFNEKLNEFHSEKSLYGTPNPKIPVSVVSCGGCGALLHCQDHAIPGYLPSELFDGLNDQELRNTICQRCHFMKYYKTTLEIKVSADEYPKILSHLDLSKKTAAVLLMIDLTDFPCSIWPNLPDIIGHNTPIFVVGNKVDLLPKDSPGFTKHIEKSVMNALLTAGYSKQNIKYLALISSKTGYGVERLISALQMLWKSKGDVYLIGCTNVGKSTLFNALLQSDYCETRASELLQRATTSPWPGTTLNLLKFPILNPSRFLLFLRMKRQQLENINKFTEIQFRRNQFISTRDIRYATLQERIGKTVSKLLKPSVSAQKMEMDRAQGNHGVDEKIREYKYSRWCYDTPGVIQTDQILHLLTTEELLLTLPKQIISPRTFIFKPNQTIFIAGLGRLDFVDGPKYVRITVFASNILPVTICHTEVAAHLYDELLLTEVFTVPVNDPKRLEIWPKLKCKEFEIVGVNDKTSSADVLLSNAGWIAITPMANDKIIVKAWTPEGRGIFLRTPALLPKSVTLRGARIRACAAYLRGRQIYDKD